VDHQGRSAAARDAPASDSAQAGVYSMGAVVRMLGIPAATLRTWEERYAIVLPQRSAGGHRLYSRDQIDQLSFVRDQVDRGTSPGDAFRLLDARMSDYARQNADRDLSVLIILAERDAYAAEFSEYFLRTEGYDCLVALDVQTVMESLADRTPSLVVVDLLISGGAGLALCQDVKRRGSIPVLAISALSSQDDALDSGADAFLQRPYEPIRFISTVKDLLGASAYLRRGTAAS
jgi:DNA-binding transcriptional MerR regulator